MADAERAKEDAEERPWRVIFMGTPEFAARNLLPLLEVPWLDVVAVVTQPDKPRGRNTDPQPPPVKNLALSRGISVVQPDRIRTPEFLQWFREQRPDLAVVVAYGRILPKDILDTPRLGCINVHASILPRHRGAAPIQHAILSGDDETGVSIMFMDEGLDTGPVLHVAKLPISSEHTSESLHNDLAALGARALVDCLAEARARGFEPAPQDHAKATLAPPLERAHGRVDWSVSSRKLHCKVRAFYPWPGATTSFRGVLVKIFPFPAPKSGDPLDASALPGQILHICADGLWVATSDRPVLLTELQFEGRRRLPAAEVARGLRMSPGESFE